MSWNNFPKWDINTPLYFQFGMILSLSAANLIINYESVYERVPAEVDFEADSGFNALNILMHIESPKVESKAKEKSHKAVIAEIKVSETPETVKIQSSLLHDSGGTDTFNINKEISFDGNQKTEETSTKKAEPSLFLNIAEQMPYLRTCESIKNEEEKRKCTQTEMLKYIVKNLKYPPLARETGLEGCVILTFVIDKEGILKDIQIKRDIGGGCGQEAVKVIKGLNNWVPGRHGNEPVNVKYTMPITFKLH